MHTSTLSQALAETVIADRHRDATIARLARRATVAAVAAAALVGTTAVSADAAPVGPKLLPTIVDGVRYSPGQMRHFQGRRLYSWVGGNGKTVIAYTKLRDYRRHLARHGLRLPTPVEAARPIARASTAQDGPVTVCLENFLGGPCRDVRSGWGVAHMHALNCDFWGSCGANFLDSVSSVRTRSRPVVLFDHVGFNMAGSSSHDHKSVVTIYTDQQVDLATVPFPVNGGTWNDRVGSLYVWW
jgi:hypothetical protein